jgi:hypothetical protein
VWSSTVPYEARSEPGRISFSSMRDHLAVALAVQRWTPGGAEEVAGGEELVDLRRVPPIPDLLLKAAHEGLVLLGRPPMASSLARPATASVCRVDGRRGGSACLGERFRTHDLEPHGGLVADDPPVMTRRNLVDVSWSELHLRAIIHANTDPTGDEMTQVVRLAAFGSG